jgi:hypothetical protein
LATAGLLAGAGVLLVLLAPRVTGWRPVDQAAPLESIVIELSRPVDPASVAGRFELQPQVDGQLRVAGSQILFEPAMPWAYDQPYTVSLASRVSGLNRLPSLSGALWSFTRRPPRLLYLLERDGVVNLWRAGEGSVADRLTDEAAGVWDYAPLADGRGLVYSRLDPGGDGTMDLMLLDEGGRAQLLLDCTDALCRSAAPQPGGRLVAYERQPLDAGLNASELWLLDLDSGQNVPAPTPAALSALGFEGPLGRYPAWSPDGIRLASFRADANMVVIMDFSAPPPAAPLTIPANLETMGGWSPDGIRLAYTELAFGETAPHEHVDATGTVISHTEPSLYQHLVVVDVEGQQAVDLSAGSEIDEGRPAWEPDGRRLVVPRTATGAGKQLFLVSADGVQATQLTDEPAYNYSSLAWSPDGIHLAFMRAPWAGAVGVPTVMLMDMRSGEVSPVAEGAFLPGWWP